MAQKVIDNNSVICNKNLPSFYPSPSSSDVDTSKIHTTELGLPYPSAYRKTAEAEVGALAQAEKEQSMETLSASKIRHLSKTDLVQLCLTVTPLKAEDLETLGKKELGNLYNDMASNVDNTALTTGSNKQNNAVETPPSIPSNVGNKGPLYEKGKEEANTKNTDRKTPENDVVSVVPPKEDPEDEVETPKNTTKSMAYVMFEVVKNPRISKEDLWELAKENCPRKPSEGTVYSQLGETIKHLRIFESLGYLTEDYASLLPPRRDLLSNPSRVTKLAVECARFGGKRTLKEIQAINRQTELPVSDPAVEYQYIDSQRILKAVKDLNVYRGE
jgi:hypothetical protein